MRNAPAAVKNYLAANNVVCRADLITITLQDGTTKYRWTTAERDLLVGGFAFASGGGSAAPIVRRGAYRQTSRLTVDTLDVTLGGPFTINGSSMGLLGVQGYFDGARLQVDHLIMPTPGDVSLGVIPSFFEGRVATVQPQGRDLVLRVKSELESLNVMLPRFTVQPQCGNAVYDTNCTLVRSTYTDSGTASGSPTTTSIPSTTAAIIARASGYYNLGVLAFTSGVNAGMKRAVVSSTLSGGTTTIALALPFPSAPAAGDAFTVYPGCDRSRARCNGTFANLAHYRGAPHIPKPEGGA